MIRSKSDVEGDNMIRLSEGGAERTEALRLHLESVMLWQPY